MKYKLIYEQLISFHNPTHILGDASQYAKEQGYKEVIYREGDKGIWQDDEFIYVETPAIIITNDDIRMQREQAYKMESDSLYMAWQKYLALDQVEKAEVKRIEWVSKINEIIERFPYITA